MAFPVVETTAVTNGTTATASAAVNLPSGVTAGDTLIVVHRCAGAGAIGWPAGWTEVFENSADASDDVTAWAWRLADGSEGATITVTQGLQKFASVAYRISGTADPTVTPPQSGTPAVGTSANPNPSATAPTGGAKEYLWVAVAAMDNESTTTVTWPTNYADNRLLADSGTAGAVGTNARVRAATRTANAASEDPGTFTVSVSSNWTAWTIGVHPAVAGTYSATVGLTGTKPVLAGTSTHAAPVYTSSATFTKAAPILAVTATFTPGPATAAAGLASQPATLAGTGSFTPGSVAGGAGLQSNPTTLAATVQLTQPFFGAAVAVASGSASVAASLTRTTPTHTATATLTSTAAQTLTASSVFSPTFVSATSLAPSAASLAAGVLSTAPTLSALVGLEPGTASLAATGAFTAPVYAGGVGLAASSATLSVAASFATGAGTYTGAGTFVGGSATLAVSVAVTNPTYSATGTLASGSATLAASVVLITDEPTGSLARSVGPVGWTGGGGLSF